MSVTRYSSADAGSPVINGLPGNGLVNLLRTCLVGSGTAYGALPKKGWTEVFTGTHKAVFRTVDGGCYLRVLHDGSNAGGYREALVRAAEGATDVDTLVDFFPSLSDVPAGNETWRMTDTLDSTAKSWVLLASENWFTLHVMFGTASNINDQYLFGRFSPVSGLNAWPYIISVRSVSNGNTQTQAASCFVASASQFSGSNYKLFAMRTPDGSVKAPRASIATQSASGASPGLPGAIGPIIPEPTGKIVIAAPHVWINGQAGGTTLNPSLAGFFPNLWSPLHNCGAIGRAAFFGDRFNAPGYDPSAQFELMGGALDTAGKWVVEITDTWQDPTA